MCVHMYVCMCNGMYVCVVCIWESRFTLDIAGVISDPSPIDEQRIQRAIEDMRVANFQIRNV